MKKYLIIILFVSLNVVAQKKDVRLKNSTWFLKVDETKIFSLDTLNFIRFSKLKCSDSKLNKGFAELCHNNKKDVTTVNFSKRKVYFSNSTFSFCGPLGNLDEWNFIYDQDNEEISFELNDNRRYLFKILDRKVSTESWDCGWEGNNPSFSAEVETVTLVKVK